LNLVADIPEAFGFLFEPARYKGAYGGRGSAKSHSVAAALVIKAAEKPRRILCTREIQKSISDSVKQLLDDKIDSIGIPGFKSTDTYIEHKCGSLFAFGGLRSNPETIKSKEGYDIAWVEEANRASRRSLDLLLPTIRTEGSELWFTWNPEHDFDPVDKMLRGPVLPPGAVVRRVSWRDNPWFPEVLRREMEFDKANDPDKYEHIWEGEYVRAQVGAYYSKQLRQARDEGRITRLALDPVHPLRAWWDLGISDHMALIVTQQIGPDMLALDCCEGQGQPLGYYFNWMRSRGYGAAKCMLPHDAAERDLLTAKRQEDHFRDAGFAVEVVKNQGKGAAMKRVEASRRWFPRWRFDEDNCAPLLKALGSYHERIDEERNVGLGPEHDWSSHFADGFGMANSVYQEPTATWSKPIAYRDARAIV
jgi:phage terminase large subunit